MIKLSFDFDFNRRRDNEEPVRWACKIMIRKAYGSRSVPPEAFDECIETMKQTLDGELSIHEATMQLSQLFDLRYDYVEKIVIKAKKRAGVL